MPGSTHETKPHAAISLEPSSVSPPAHAIWRPRRAGVFFQGAAVPVRSATPAQSVMPRLIALFASSIWWSCGGPYHAMTKSFVDEAKRMFLAVARTRCAYTIGALELMPTPVNLQKRGSSLGRDRSHIIYMRPMVSGGGCVLLPAGERIFRTTPSRAA